MFDNFGHNTIKKDYFNLNKNYFLTVSKIMLIDVFDLFT